MKKWLLIVVVAVLIVLAPFAIYTYYLSGLAVQAQLQAHLPAE